jgi:hypothetical protein
LTHANNVYLSDVNTSTKSPTPSKEILFAYDPFFEVNPDKIDGAFTGSCYLLSSTILSKFNTGSDGHCVYTRSAYEEVYTFTSNDLIVAGSTLGNFFSL